MAEANPTDVPPRNPQALFERIGEARAAAKPVPKLGKNTKQHYDYARAEDVIGEARAVLRDAGLIVVPSIRHVEATPTETSQGGRARIVDVTLDFDVIDTASGERWTWRWAGSGWDAPGDKAILKAITGGTKYFLAYLLGIPFGVDPEEDGGEGRARRAPAKSTGPTIPKARVAKLFKAVPKDRTWKQVGVLLGAAGIDGLRAGSGKALHERLETLTPEQADALEAMMKDAA